MTESFTNNIYKDMVQQHNFASQTNNCFIDTNKNNEIENDENNNERDLLLVEKIDNVLKFVSNETCYIETNGKRVKYSNISLNTFYNAKIVNNHKLLFKL